MENVNSAALTCRAETAPVTEAQPGAGAGAAPRPQGHGTPPRPPWWHRGDASARAGGTVWVGNRQGAAQERRGCGDLALAEGGEGAWLPKPDGLDAELLNYEY